MIEIMLIMAVIIIVLGFILWLSMKSAAQAKARAEEAYVGLQRIRQAHEAVAKQMETEQEQQEDDQKNINDRHHFDG